jgi:hypothetical protein
VNELNRKIMLIFASLFIISMMLAPLAIAKPGAQKNNDKFDFFQLICSGHDMGEGSGQVWLSPPNSEHLNVWHLRDAPWDESSVYIVELTAGDETFTMTTLPYSVDYTTTFDLEAFYDNTGVVKNYNIRLTDVVTVYDEGEEVGTLVLKIVAVVEYTDGNPSGYHGTVMGYGTEALKTVHISAVDLGFDPINLYYVRVGTITGWPEQITNIIS